jgi:acyl-CoA reductase-like NAD-dependent aldehyde dehydrogenase
MALAVPPQLDNLLVVKNPVNGTTVAELPIHTADDLRKMVARARQAQPAWQALGVKERAKRLRRWADLVWERQAEVMRVIRSETGKVDAGALLEVIGVDIVTSYYMHRAPRWLKDQWKLPLIPFVHRAQVTYKPHGLVGVISPWNYPFILPFMDLLPALFAGNVVIVKPSEVTPLSVKIGVELMHEAGIPEGVIQALYGDGRIGAELVEHADFIAFTGSTATGRKIARRCGERLVPCTMELGGKDPSIVLSDAKLDMAAAGVIRGAFENAGQVCVSIERVYVEEAIYEPFVAKVLDLMQAFKVGSGDGDSYHMGSLTNVRELERTEQHIADAVSKGAKVVFGGKRRPDLGPLFFEPTVLVDVTHDMDIMREETFGPTLPIMRVKNAEEAIKLANDNEYGLSASIFSTNYARARQLAKQIDSGDVSINRTHLSVGTVDLPTGGQRNSGMGRRNGREGLLKYVAVQSILSDNMFAQTPDLRVGDPLSLTALRFMRIIRRYVPFV